MQTNRLNDYLSTSFFTLLIYLHCSDTDYGRGDVSRDVSYGIKEISDFYALIFFRYLSDALEVIEK